jgi:hypothetical protein
MHPILKQILPGLFKKKPALSFCILMDLIGMATYLVPGWAEWADVVWAPISGFLFNAAFGGIGGMVGGVISFLEELIPFTDLIPTFTLAWWLLHSYKGKISGNSTPTIEDAEVIEIK